ncbi:MAG: hypothetical protein WC155_03775, partial [Candidatus Cloacimonadales bacterium]
MKRLLSLLLLVAPIFLFTETLEVSPDGTKPYTIVQEAINQAVSGDIILVYPGRYYENLDLSNRSGLTLASLEYTTGNDNYISETIIDGSNNSESTILCYENTIDCAIQGLSITGGKGNDFNGEAHNIMGGGIFIYQNNSLTLKSLNIFGNRAALGGGVSISFSSSVYLEDVNIYNNIARWRGGGLLIGGMPRQSYDITFSQTNRCSIYNNFANWGMDVDWFRTFNYTGEIYLKKFTKSTYAKYFADWYEVDIDHNPEANPYVVFDVEEAFLTEADCSLYVSPTGSDENDGFTENTALKTPSIAMQRILPNPDNPNTVYLLNGEHHNLILGEYMSISVKDYSILKGVSPDLTKIYGHNMMSGSSIITFVNNSNSATIKDFSISTDMARSIGAWRVYDCLIENILIEDVSCEWGNFVVGGPNASFKIKDVTLRNVHALYSEFGPRLWGNDIEIDNLTVQDCYTNEHYDPMNQSNGALDIDNRGTAIVKNSTFINNTHYSDTGFSLIRSICWGNSLGVYTMFSNCLIANNRIFNNGQNLTIVSSEACLINNTIVNNEYSCQGAVIVEGGDCYMGNNILSNNYTKELTFFNSGAILENNLFSRENCDSSINNYNVGTLLVNENNIFGQDPLFAGDDPATKEHYRLFADNENGFSPAIDA